MSRATSLAASAQQVSLSMGVALGALAVEIMVRLKAAAGDQRGDFQPAFLLVAAISASSALVFWWLPADAGAELADRMPAPNEAVRSAGRLSSVAAKSGGEHIELGRIRRGSRPA